MNTCMKWKTVQRRMGNNHAHLERLIYQITEEWRNLLARFCIWKWKKKRFPQRSWTLKYSENWIELNLKRYRQISVKIGQWVSSKIPISKRVIILDGEWATEYDKASQKRRLFCMVDREMVKAVVHKTILDNHVYLYRNKVENLWNVKPWITRRMGSALLLAERALRRELVNCGMLLVWSGPCASILGCADSVLVMIHNMARLSSTCFIFWSCGDQCDKVKWKKRKVLKRCAHKVHMHSQFH